VVAVTAITEAELAGELTAATRYEFDLATETPVRAQLFVLAPDHCRDDLWPVGAESLSLTANCKLDRAALPAPTGRPDFDHDYMSPRNRTEETIAAVWAEVLGVERVRADDNFFALGGDSILAITVVSRTRARVSTSASGCCSPTPRWPGWPRGPNPMRSSATLIVRGSLARLRS
jgi:hypothetical protein